MMKNKYTILIIIFAFISLIVSSYKYKISLNITSSMPYGLYIKSSGKIEKGDYILFCLLEAERNIGLVRGYLEPGKRCNGSIPLIKKVISLPGETVKLTDDSIIVSNQVLNYKTIYNDSQNRKLKVYPRGTYTKNCYWVVGDRDILHSWDSRYWGCIKTDQIITKLKPFFIW